jgi:hypothetical protein
VGTRPAGGNGAELARLHGKLRNSGLDPCGSLRLSAAPGVPLQYQTRPPLAPPTVDFRFLTHLFQVMEMVVTRATAIVASGCHDTDAHEG